MGFAFSSDFQKMAIACRYSIGLFQNSTQLAQHYPTRPNTYDALYMPRVTYHTNALDIHDLEIINDEIYGVNTLFSCIMKTSASYTFDPVWQPNFITELASEDRCHLNGMVVVDDKIRFVTAFNTGNRFRSWSADIPHTGVLLSVEDNEIISHDLSMPHSPIWVNGELYLLESGLGQLVKIDLSSGKAETIKHLGGFVRGLTFYQGYFLIGRSRTRDSGSILGKLNVDKKYDVASVVIMHAETAAIVGEIVYENSVDEIYDVGVLPSARPNILSTEKEESKLGVSIPESTFWARPKA